MSEHASEKTHTAERHRVSFTPGSISGLVTAAARYRCDGHLSDRHMIEAGQRYVANALPPHNPDIGNPGWWHLRVCLDCCPIEFEERAACGGTHLGGCSVPDFTGVCELRYPPGEQP